MPVSTRLCHSHRVTLGLCSLTARESWLAFGLCAGLLWTAAPASAAGWLGKKTTVRKPEPAVAAPQQGFAGTIRRLTNEARAAADRGDLEAARKSAERAYKLAVTCRTSLANAPDCSPETLAELIRRLNELSGAPPVAASPLPQPNSSQFNDLSTMLDEPLTEAPPLVPPSPTPAVTSPAIVPRAVPAVVVTKKPAPSAATAAAPRSPTRAKTTAAAPSRAAEPWQTPGTSRVPSAPQSFLVMRSDWLANGVAAEKLIEQPDAEPKLRTPVRRPQASARKPVQTDDRPEAEEVSEVTTAIGRAQDARWELDLNPVETESDASWDSRPTLERRPETRISRPVEPQPPAAIESSPIQDPQSLGVWSGGIPTFGSPSRVKNVVSLSEFFDPTISVTAERAGRTVSAEIPQMIETDFRAPPAPQPSAPREEFVSNLPARRPLAAQHLDRDTREDQETRPSQTEGPVVSFREDPALDWLPASAPEAEPRLKARNWLQIVWHSAWESQSNQIVGGGLLLLLCGLTLFGLSFRRA